MIKHPKINILKNHSGLKTSQRNINRKNGSKKYANPQKCKFSSGKESKRIMNQDISKIF